MFIQFLKTTPFVRFVVPLIIGIITGKYLYPFNVPVYLFAVLLSVYLLLYIIKPLFRSEVSSVIMFVLFALLGIHLHEFQNSAVKLDDRFIDSEKTFVVALTDFPEEKENSYKVYADVLSVHVDSLWIRCNAKAVFYLSKSKSIDSLKAGQKLMVQTVLKEHLPKANYFDFDYGAYLRNKKINYSAFVKADDWVLSDSCVTGLRNYSLGLRNDLLSLYRESGLNGNEFAVFSALTLGYKNDLDKELRNSFAGAGAMHILAVSGMHVGIVYLILNKLLSLFGLLSVRYRFRYIIILSGIWFYAMLTGLSPSVTRAAVMATFLLLGRVICKKVYIYNSIAASAFVLLLYNTNYLFDVGFQLSYTALIGIVYFYKRVYSLIYIKFRPIDYLWQLTAVGISAQIGTFPLSIYYFGLFPVYFWLTGALVVMLAFVMMSGAFVLVVVSFVEPVFKFTGAVLHYITLALEIVVSAVNTLPYSVLEFFSICGWQVFLLYLAVILFVSGVVCRKVRLVMSGLVFILIFQIQNLYAYSKTSSEDFISMSNIRNNSMVNIVENGHCLCIVSDTNDVTLDYSVGGFCSYERIDKSKFKLLTIEEFKDSELRGKFLFKEKRVQVYSGVNGEGILGDSLDYLLLTGKGLGSKMSVLEKFKPSKIIVDVSVPQWTISSIKGSGLSVFNTFEDGAFKEIIE